MESEKRDVTKIEDAEVALTDLKNGQGFEVTSSDISDS